MYWQSCRNSEITPANVVLRKTFNEHGNTAIFPQKVIGNWLSPIDCDRVKYFDR